MSPSVFLEVYSGRLPGDVSLKVNDGLRTQLQGTTLDSLAPALS